MCGVRRDCTPRKRALRSKWSKSTLKIKSAEKIKQSKRLARNQTIKIPQIPLSHPTLVYRIKTIKIPKKSREIKNTVCAPRPASRGDETGPGRGRPADPVPEAEPDSSDARAPRERLRKRETRRGARDFRASGAAAHICTRDVGTLVESRAEQQKKGGGGAQTIWICDLVILDYKTKRKVYSIRTLV